MIIFNSPSEGDRSILYHHSEHHVQHRRGFQSIRRTWTFFSRGSPCPRILIFKYQIFLELLTHNYWAADYILARSRPYTYIIVRGLLLWLKIRKPTKVTCIIPYWNHFVFIFWYLERVILIFFVRLNYYYYSLLYAYYIYL